MNLLVLVEMRFLEILMQSIHGQGGLKQMSMSLYPAIETFVTIGSEPRCAVCCARYCVNVTSTVGNQCWNCLNGHRALGNFQSTSMALRLSSMLQSPFTSVHNEPNESENHDEKKSGGEQNLGSLILLT